MKRFIRLAFILALSVIATIGASAAKAPKYVFYFIGDGMSLQHVVGTEIYRAQKNGQKVGYEYLPFTQFEVNTFARNRSANSDVTDSSAAGTALATGFKTENGMLGVKEDGKTPVYSIAVAAQKAGYKVGITTSVGINHATPASFYGHQASRNDYYELGRQLIDSQFDFFGGATFITSKGDEDKPNLVEEAQKGGYTVAKGYDQYKALKAQAEKVLLIPGNANGSIPYAIDCGPNDLTLPQITESAIDFLSSSKKGFFLMVEGGQIDGGGHNNDAAAMFGEVIAFSEAIDKAIEFYKQHPNETLIVVSADHGTGAFSIGIEAYMPNFGILKYQKGSRNVLSNKMLELREQKQNKVSWDDMKQLLADNLGLFREVPVSLAQEIELMQTFQTSFANRGNAQMVQTLYSNNTAMAAKAIAVLDRIAEVSWGSGSHSGAVVPVFVQGVGSENFRGPLDNTDLPKIMAKIAGFEL